MNPRRPTHQISVGDQRVGIVRIGGGLPDRNGNPTAIAPVSVQTMTSGYTHDIAGCVAEINKLAEQGLAIVLVSSELPEVLGLSDRVMVLHEGRVTGEFVRADATPEKVMAAATGNH